MAINHYQKFKISINPDSKKIQSLQPGDIVRRQYVDGVNTIYTLMTVLETGEDEVINDKGVISKSPYFIGALLEGDIPNSQQLLDFVRITNLFNADRSGALYMTASDSNAPFIQIIDKLGTEKSICLPYLPSGTLNQPSKDKYSCLGESFLTCIYNKYTEGVYRAYKVTRNNVSTSEKLQIKVTFDDTFKIQDKVLISYKIRSSKDMVLPYSFGYTDGSSFEGSDDIQASNDWEYKLHIIQIDSPARETRSFAIDLVGLNTDDWVEIAELNIIKLSDVANCAEAGKAIIGNINSVVDPVFGTLKGYGIHTENFYATKNVGIAGTLTAGDSNGFSSTFYAGRIYKNMIKNSLSCDFNNTAEEVSDIKIPSKIGSAYKFKEGISLHRLTCRESGWSEIHKGEIVTFSIWIYSTSKTTLNVYQNTNKIDTWEIYLGWRRYYVTFPVKESGDPLYINFETNAPLIVCSPQLEMGDTVSQYQPTDGILKEDSEGYGAWFCEGGIGGTIQNPLLKLGADGSIRSRNDEFYILPDGSAYFKGQMEIGDKSTIGGVTLIKDGKINTAILEVKDIFAQNIETEIIVGASLNFQKGTIGGWKITADSLTSETTPGRDHVEMSTLGGIKAVVASKTVWQLSPTGSGILASGKIKWDAAGNTTIAGWNITDDRLYSTPTSNNEKIELNSNGSIKSLTGSTINWILNNDGSGKFARGNVTWDKLGNLSLTGSITASGGTIGGWIINSSSIKKNNIYLGSDGSIYHTNNYWKLNNDGSGQLAGGAIKWGTDGVWNVDKITAKSGSIGAWIIDSDSIYSGSKQTSNDYTYSGITLSSAGALRAKQFRIDTNGNAYFKGTLNAAGGTFSGNLSAAGGTFTGTLSGVNGDFSGSITATSGRIGNWNITNSEMTYNDVHLSSNGDLHCTYGGTQYWRIDNLGNASFAKGKALFNNDGSGQLAGGKISWLANGTLTIDSSVKVNASITADQINSLTLTTTKGTIGGWNISSNAISKNNVYLGSDGSIYNGNYWKLNKDGSGQLANSCISWTSAGLLTISAGAKIADFTVDTSRLKYVGTNYSTTSKLYIGNVDSGNPDTEGARITALGIDANFYVSSASALTQSIKNMFIDNIATSNKKTSMLIKTTGGAKNTAMSIFGNVAISGDIANIGMPVSNTLPNSNVGFDHNTCLITSATSLTLPTGESLRSWFGDNPNAWKNYGATSSGGLDGTVYDLYVVIAPWHTSSCTIYGNPSGNGDYSGITGTPLYGIGVDRTGYGKITLQPGRSAHFKKVGRQWFCLGVN